jgi:alpha-tubulin suppressor-like RCC1 family protein
MGLRLALLVLLPLIGVGKRRRGHPGSTPPSVTHENAIWACGHGKGSKLGGEYHTLGVYSYAQKCPTMTRVVQLAIGSSVSLALDDNGAIWVAGNGEEGAGGLGGAGEFNDTWTRITGGVPLYKREKFVKSSPKAEWWQPTGPVGPYLPTKADVAAGAVHQGRVSTWTIAAVANAGAHCAALTTDGRVLAWGASRGGTNGNGWETGDKLLEEESLHGQYPQQAPWWVQIAGPEQSEPGKKPGGKALASGVIGTEGATYEYDSPEGPSGYGAGTGSNILTGVKAIDAGEGVLFFLLEDGHVAYSGSPAGAVGTYRHLYAQLDPVWTPDPANLPVALQATKGGYTLLLEDGTPRFVGNDAEYTAGDGVLRTSTTKREVLVPLTGPGKPATGVIALAKGEFSAEYLKDDGTVWGNGSNIEKQQGEPGRPITEPVRYVTKREWCRDASGALVSLYAGGLTVVAISGAGETTHTANKSTGERLPGANGGDSYLYLMSDGTIRVKGLNWGYNSGAPERWEPGGVLAQGNFENSDVPVTPRSPQLNKIKQVCAGTIHWMALQEPATPAPKSMSFTPLGAGELRADWIVPGDGTPPTAPQVREPESFSVILHGQTGAATGLTFRSPVLANRDGSGNLVRTYTFTGLPTGQYEALISENSQMQAYDPNTGTWSLVSGPGAAPVASGVAVANVAAATWTAPPLAETGLIREYRRREPYVEKGAVPFTLSVAVPSGVPVGSLSVSALPEKLPGGQQITAKVGSEWVNFTTKGQAEKGATTVAIVTTTPALTVGSGTSLIATGQEDWRRSTPELSPAGGSGSFPLDPSPHGVTDQRYEERILGAAEGVWGGATLSSARICSATVS